MCMLAGTQDIQAQELMHISRMCKGAHQSHAHTHMDIYSHPWVCGHTHPGTPWSMYVPPLPASPETLRVTQHF